MPRRVKINGESGRWVAEVERRWSAVLHNTHGVKPHGHFAPFDRGDPRRLKRHDEFELALKAHHLVVMQIDTDPVSLGRGGHVGVFPFSDLLIDYLSGISLRIAKRYADPKSCAERPHDLHPHDL